MSWAILSKKGFLPNPIFRIFLVIAIILASSMALTSNFNHHPDELHHFEAVKYYVNNFLPPKIDDPSIRDSYSAYGVSYLNYQWAEYFFAGKFVFFISPIINNPLIVARFFAVFLFSVLALLFIWQSNNKQSTFIIPCFLLVSPQIWYVFSYVNNDAFALFVSLVVSYQIAHSQSLLNKFLSSQTFTKDLVGGIWFGILIGFLLIVKPNYWTFLIFTALWLAFTFPPNSRTLKKFAFISLVALSVLTLRCGADFYVNGETNFVGFSYLNKFFGNIENAGKLAAYQEEIAEYAFRPSTLENDLANSFPGLKLKDKGASLTDLFLQRDLQWHKHSFDSFVGVYGYMNIRASDKYYLLMVLIYLLFGIYVAVSILYSKSSKSIKQLVIVSFSCLSTILVSVLLSWTYAFQPQGRYLFPIVGMFGLFVYENRRHFNSFVVNIFIAATFLLSLYSFVFVALLRINN